MCFRGLMLSAAAFLTLIAVTSAEEGGKYLLRYKFHAGETARWKVEHRSRIRTSVSGTTQNAETISDSVKVWKVTAVKSDGTAVFEHSVEDIEMRQQLTGCEEVRYNSKTDKEIPKGFDNVAAAVGATLSIITLDPLGKVVDRERMPVKGGAQTDGEITIPLPEAAMSVGATWTRPHDLEITANNGCIVRIKTLQRYTLREVQTGVATIDVCTQILTPVHDPAIESQLVQYASKGSVRFDLDQGRVLSQQMDLDKSVVGFRGDASSIHYITRFSEELLSEPPRVARKPDQP